MKLATIIADLEHVDDTMCIVAKRPWTPDSDAKLTALTEQLRIPADVLAEGYAYFLEVSTAIDEVLGDQIARLTDAQRVEAIIFHAENDASPDWLSAMR